ncbi:hypothetical protein [Bacillus sp. mrc49]|uniref:hypothetical protein n=1 Tax=Bacillus sp. mrc49 TaxID=2054913 RepID=UPI000C27FE41|nr:hypothetical protein [Bacillus sp. mrc49]PJN91557.1 hypothetical protein CVN76_04310 [Bacillus sp. mrc49]
MKKFIKKMYIVMLISVIGITGLFTFTSSASAASGCNDTSSGTELNRTFKVCGKDSGDNVIGEIYGSGFQTYGKTYWKMDLQRNVNGSYQTIGTRNGYIDWGSNSSRTFTNVLKKNAKTRIKVTYYFNSSHSDPIPNGTVYSGYWYR